jgi:hypothetical protein
MARGMSCRECGHSMQAIEEREEPKGSWVKYRCRNASCPSKWEEKVFEPK